MEWFIGRTREPLATVAGFRLLSLPCVLYVVRQTFFPVVSPTNVACCARSQSQGIYSAVFVPSGGVTFGSAAGFPNRRAGNGNALASDTTSAAKYGSD